MSISCQQWRLHFERVRLLATTARRHLIVFNRNTNIQTSDGLVHLGCQTIATPSGQPKQLVPSIDVSASCTCLAVAAADPFPLVG